MLRPETAGMLRSTGAKVIYYYKDEAFTQYNALLTAEALISLLMQTLPCALDGAEIGVAGYGRIGSVFARYLTALGAKVTVFARRPETRLQAEKEGITALSFEELRNRCGLFRTLVNTVPAPVLGREALMNLPRECVLIEVAGAPYGIEEAAAEELGFTYIPAPGLPGKYAPESAGAAIADTAVHLLAGGEEKWNP
jgi:dipicolinate synthase subunit A